LHGNVDACDDAASLTWETWLMRHPSNAHASWCRLLVFGGRLSMACCTPGVRLRRLPKKFRIGSMVAAAEVQWSQLQRDAKSVAKLVDDAGQVRVRRRDGVPLLLSREDRATAADAGAITAARALRNALVHLPGDAAAEVLREEFPWVDVLPPADLAVFVTDFVRAVQASAELGSWTLLAQTITEWQGTAVIHADPELRASLVDPVPEGDDFGSVPSPAGR
jgi:hypothetical protein